MTPDLFIVARSDSDESAAKLEITGADRTLSPYSAGGRRLASMANQPSVVDFLDVVTRGNREIEFRLEEFSVDKDSPLAGHTIGELDVFGQTGARILAIIGENQQFTTNPTAEKRTSAGDTPIVLGTPRPGREPETSGGRVNFPPVRKSPFLRTASALRIKM